MRHVLVLLALIACKATVPTEPDPCSGISGHVDRDGDGFGDPALESSSCTENVVDDATDCDDSTVTVNPEAEEICDGLDNDCDGDIDLDDSEVDALILFQDLDGDGYGAGPSQAFCEPQAMGSELDGDCDDADPIVNPETPEVCDGLDNNCDGLVDDDDPATENVPVWFLDTDMDGYAGGSIQVSCVQPPGSDIATTDCDDNDPERYPGAIEICDNADQNCDNGPDAEMFGFDVCATFEGPYEGTWTGTFVGDAGTVLCNGTADVTIDRDLTPPVQGTFSCDLNTNPAAWEALQTGAITGRFLEDGSIQGEAVALEGNTYSWEGTVVSDETVTGSGSGLLVAADTWTVDFSLDLEWPFL